MSPPEWVRTARKIGGIILMACGIILLGLFILDHFGVYSAGLSANGRMLAAGMGIMMLMGGYFQFELARKP